MFFQKNLNPRKNSLTTLIFCNFPLEAFKALKPSYFPCSITLSFRPIYKNVKEDKQVATGNRERRKL
jgi:hypothetical protein